MEAAGVRRDAATVALDDEDPDGRTVLVHYPSIVAAGAPYVRPSVRIEAGAKSALDPHVAADIEPYVAVDASLPELRVRHVTTIEPQRTFWDKVVILHGLRRWFENRNELRQEGQRISRHYYDVHCVLGADVGPAAVADLRLGAECVRHARMFFDRAPFDLASAAPGTFAVAPATGMLDRLERDYESMTGMVFGPIPAFDDVVASITGLERRLNQRV